METVQPADDQHGDQKKAPRKRTKKLMSAIKTQMEFYFSDSNLQRDRFMKKLTDESPDGYIDLSVFLNFNKLKALSTDLKIIAKALAKSDLIEVSPDGSKIKRAKPVSNPVDVDARTVYVECLPPHADHEWVRRIFAVCGVVNYVSLPRYKTSGDLKGFGFVEFATEEAAQNAVEILDNPPLHAAERPGSFPKTNKALKQLRKQDGDEGKKFDEGTAIKNNSEGDLAKPSRKRGHSECSTDGEGNHHKGDTAKHSQRKRGHRECSTDGEGHHHKHHHGCHKRRRQFSECSTDSEGYRRKRKISDGDQSQVDHGRSHTVSDCTGDGDHVRHRHGKRNMSSSSSSDDCKKLKQESAKAETVEIKGDTQSGKAETVENPSEKDQKELEGEKEKVSEKGENKEQCATENPQKIEQTEKVVGKVKGILKPEGHEIHGEEYRKRKHNEESESESDSKRVKIAATPTECQTGDIYKKKKNRRRKKKLKEKIKHKDIMPKLRVLSKNHWLSLKKEYLSLQRANISSLKQSLKTHQTSSAPSVVPQKETVETETKVRKDIEFVPNVIVKVVSKEPLVRKSLKDQINNDGIAYMDIKDGDLDGHIRCKDEDTANKVAASCYDNIEQFTLLSGDAEKQYWDKLTADRQNKLTAKKPRKRGLQKVLEKAEKIIADSNRQHIFFED